MVSELREDLVTGACVIVAPGRSTRPDTFRTAAAALPPSVSDCPFCDGNEHDTPPEVARRGPGIPDMPGWRVRVVPNKYPIVGEGVAGVHEVVVMSPAHDRSFADLDIDAATEVLIVVRERIAFQLAAGYRHAHAFVNHGKPAGASIEHPHAQVIALDFVPPFVDRVLDRFAVAQRDLVHDAIDEARAARCVVDDGDVVTWCPPASTTSYAMRCALPFGRQRFDNASDGEVRAVAVAVHDLLTRLRDVLGDVPYNVVINTPPSDDARPFHWWIDVTPRLTVTAGFEAATGVNVCTVAPEAAAAALLEGAVTVTVSIVIEAPPSEVWAVIEPIETHVEWMADAESITFTGEQHRGVGTTFECLTRIGPFRTNDRMIVTEWEPDRVMGIAHRGLFTGTGRFVLEPVGRTQTRFTWTEEIHFPWWMAGPAGARGAQPILQRVWRANLERLAHLVASRA